MEIAESPHIQGKGIPTIKTESNDVKSEFPDPNGPQGHPGGWDPYYNPPGGYPPYPPHGNPPGGFPPYPPPGQMYPGQYLPPFDPNYGPPWNAPNYYFQPPAWPNWGMPVAPSPYGGGVNPPAPPGGVGHVQNDASMSGAPPNNIEKPGIDAQKYGKRCRSEWETDESLPKNWKKRSFEIKHTNTKSGKATMFEYLSPSNQIYPSRSKMAEHMKEDGRYTREEIDKVERSRKSYMSSGVQQKNFSTRFTDWETDTSLPDGWKKRSYQNNNKNTKTGKMTKFQYLNPEGQIIPSRIQVIDYMVKSGIYSQEDILKVKEGKSHRRTNEMMGGGNNEGEEVYKHDSNQGGYSNNQMNQSVDSALGNSINTNSQIGVNNGDPTEPYKNNFGNLPNQWEQPNFLNNQSNQLGVDDLKISANPPFSNPNGISNDVKNENLLRKFPGVSFTKFQESATIKKVTPITNDSSNVKDTVSLIKNLPGIAIEQVTENTPRMDDGSINEHNVIKSSNNLQNAENTSENYQNSWTNDNLVEKKRRKVERSEWEIDDCLPYGWKRRSYDNSWNRNGEKYSVTKYEYMSPSEKMFNTRIKVLEHMLELPTIYSEEHIMNFQNSQKKMGRKARPFVPDGNVHNLDQFNDTKEELAFIAEHFYTNSEIPNNEIGTDYTDRASDNRPKNSIPYNGENIYTNSKIINPTEISTYIAKENRDGATYCKSNEIPKALNHSDKTTNYKSNDSVEDSAFIAEKFYSNSENPKPTEMPNYVASGNLDNSDKAVNKSSQCIDTVFVSDQRPIFENADYGTKDSKNTGWQIENNINKMTSTENHSLKPFKELLISKAEESINDTEKVLVESRNDNVYNTNVSFDANEFINSTEKSSNYEAIASFNNSTNDSKNDEELIEGHLDKIELTKTNAIKKFTNTENHNLKPIVSTAEESINKTEKLFEESKNDNIYNTDVSFNANEFINSTEIGNNSMNDSREWSEKLTIENRNYKDAMKDTEEVFEQSGNNLLESTEHLVQVNNDFGKSVEESENLTDFENYDSSYSLDSTDFFMNDTGVRVEKSTYDHEVSSNNNSHDISDNHDISEVENCFPDAAKISYDDSEISNSDSFDLSSGDFLEMSDKYDAESTFSDKASKNICDDTEIFDSDFSETFSDDIHTESGKSEMSLDNFCDDSGMPNSDFSEICNGDISDKTENSELGSDYSDSTNYSKASYSDFTEVISDGTYSENNSTNASKEKDVENNGDNLDKSVESDKSRYDFSGMNEDDLFNETDNSELGHNFPDNSKKLNNDSSDYSETSTFDLSELSSDTISDNSEIFNDTPSENLEKLDGSSEAPKQMENCEDSDDSNISETGEENSFHGFMGPTISMNVSEFSMLALLFTKNPNPSRSMIDDMSEDMEIASKDIKWTFIKLRAKFQGKKGQPVDAKPVEDMMNLIKTQYGQNTFTF